MNKKNLKNLELIKKINKDFLINQKSDIFICLILLLIVSLTTAIYPFLIQKVFDNFTENKYSWFFLPTIIALHRSHKKTNSILFLNIIIGWTGMGRILLLAYSLLSDSD